MWHKKRKKENSSHQKWNFFYVNGEIICVKIKRFLNSSKAIESVSNPFTPAHFC